MNRGKNRELVRLLAQFRKRSGALMVALFRGMEMIAVSSSREVKDFSHIFEGFYSSANFLFKEMGIELKSILLEGEDLSAYVTRLTPNFVIFILFSPDTTSFGSVKLGVMQIKTRIEAEESAILGGEFRDKDTIDERIGSIQDEELDKLIDVLKAELKSNLTKE